MSKAKVAPIPPRTSRTGEVTRMVICRFVHRCCRCSGFSLTALHSPTAVYHHRMCTASGWHPPHTVCTGGGGHPGGCSKAESRSTTATTDKSANDHPCDFTGSTCSSMGRGATLGLDTSVWCIAVWLQTAVQYARGATPLLYTGVLCIAVWWWRKPGRMQQG